MKDEIIVWFIQLKVASTVDIILRLIFWSNEVGIILEYLYEDQVLINCMVYTYTCSTINTKCDSFLQIQINWILIRISQTQILIVVAPLIWYLKGSSTSHPVHYWVLPCIDRLVLPCLVSLWLTVWYDLQRKEDPGTDKTLPQEITDDVDNLKQEQLEVCGPALWGIPWTWKRYLQTEAQYSLVVKTTGS